MPPRKSRKRPLPPPSDEPPAKRTVPVGRNLGGVFEALDSLHENRSTAEDAKAFLESAGNSEESSESNSSEDDFEDVPLGRKHVPREKDQDTDEDMDWEDAIQDELGDASEAQQSSRNVEHKDLDLTLSKPDLLPSLTDAVAGSGKKGPTKIERFIRIQTHCMHVQFLLWHNTIRNSWLNDKGIHDILVNGLSEGLKAEVKKWRNACRLSGQNTPTAPKMENGTEWSSKASRVEPETPDMSHGDPTLRLLKYLVAYWKKKFTITAPGLRKRGYQSVRDRDTEIKAFMKEPSNPKFGERIASLEDFRQAAKTLRGSRDIGAQLFTALVRGLGIQTRMVASLQPAGFGWTKVEEAKPKKAPMAVDPSPTKLTAGKSVIASSEANDQKSTTKPKMRLRGNGSTSAPINISDSSSELSDAISVESDSELSSLEKTVSVAATALKNKGQFDKDLHYPIYWSEVLSPITNTYLVVSSSTTPTIATSPEQLQSFEPRGAAAEKAKQVICYVVAFSSDGSAKDVTVRYLKRRQLPGKTKGFRLPPEKIPIHNMRGKIVKYEEYDWFKRVMSLYARRTRTLADDIEDQGDLVPAKATKTAEDSGVETLQGYKNSTEFVLQRHLRREEAVPPSKKPVKYFTVGKGEKETKEPVYRRKDVVNCKTVESWQKEGRELRIGEQPLKLVPIRAVTLLRKVEVEQALRENGKKPLQGLYSRAQTDWIIPPPIKDGKIPRNAFGSIDIYVPSMIPQGAVHVPLGGTVRICKKLGIDFAEACTGFEFGSQRAVPILTGVVVAQENEHLLIDAWEEEQERKRFREDAKREKLLLGLWRKFAIGLRIIERVKAEYGEGGEIPDEVNPFMNSKRQGDSAQIKGTIQPAADREMEDVEAENAGGFFRPGYNVEESSGGGFLAGSENEAEAVEQASELEIYGQSSQKDHVEGQPLHDGQMAGHSGQNVNAPRSLRSSLRHAPTDASPSGSEDESDEADEEYVEFSARKKTVIRGGRRSMRR